MAFKPYDSVEVRHKCFWFHQFIPKRMLNTEDTLLGAYFLLAKLAFEQGTSHVLTTDKMYNV